MPNVNPVAGVAAVAGGAPKVKGDDALVVVAGTGAAAGIPKEKPAATAGLIAGAFGSDLEVVSATNNNVIGSTYTTILENNSKTIFCLLLKLQNLGNKR